MTVRFLEPIVQNGDRERKRREPVRIHRIGRG
jgi:hypothetical protein